MMKCKQRCDPAPSQGARERAPREKVSGCFRTFDSAVDFANIEELEELVLSQPTQATLGKIHQIKRELLALRRAV